MSGMTGAEWEKEWKGEDKRRVRRAVRWRRQQCSAADGDALVRTVMDGVAVRYDGPKDGEQDFDAGRHPRLMRR